MPTLPILKAPEEAWAGSSPPPPTENEPKMPAYGEGLKRYLDQEQGDKGIKGPWNRDISEDDARTPVIKPDALSPSPFVQPISAKGPKQRDYDAELAAAAGDTPTLQGQDVSPFAQTLLRWRQQQKLNAETRGLTREWLDGTNSFVEKIHAALANAQDALEDPQSTLEADALKAQAEQATKNYERAKAWSDAAQQYEADRIAGYLGGSEGPADLSQPIPEEGKEFGQALATKAASGIIKGTGSLLEATGRITERLGATEAKREKAIRDQYGVPEDASPIRVGDAIKQGGEYLRLQVGEPISQFGKSFVVPQDVEKHYPILLGAAEKAGMAVPFLFLGAMASIPAGTAGGAFVGAAAMGAQSYEDTYKAAIAKGASEEDAHNAAAIAGATNSLLMTVPMGQWLSGLQKPFQDGMIREVLGLASHGLTFATVMQAQKALDNLIAHYTYDPDRKLAEGLGDPKGMMEDVLAGVVLSVPGVIVQKMREPEGAPKPPPVPSPEEQQAKHLKDELQMQRDHVANMATRGVPEDRLKQAMERVEELEAQVPKEEEVVSGEGTAPGERGAITQPEEQAPGQFYRWSRDGSGKKEFFRLASGPENDIENIAVGDVFRTADGEFVQIDKQIGKDAFEVRSGMNTGSPNLVAGVMRTREARSGLQSMLRERGGQRLIPSEEGRAPEGAGRVAIGPDRYRVTRDSVEKIEPSAEDMAKRFAPGSLPDRITKLQAEESGREVQGNFSKIDGELGELYNRLKDEDPKDVAIKKEINALTDEDVHEIALIAEKRGLNAEEALGEWTAEGGHRHRQILDQAAAAGRTAAPSEDGAAAGPVAGAGRIGSAAELGAEGAGRVIAEPAQPDAAGTPGTGAVAGQRPPGLPGEPAAAGGQTEVPEAQRGLRPEGRAADQYGRSGEPSTAGSAASAEQLRRETELDGIARNFRELLSRSDVDRDQWGAEIQRLGASLNEIEPIIKRGLAQGWLRRDADGNIRKSWTLDQLRNLRRFPEEESEADVAAPPRPLTQDEIDRIAKAREAQQDTHEKLTKHYRNFSLRNNAAIVRTNRALYEGRPSKAADTLQSALSKYKTPFPFTVFSGIKSSPESPNRGRLIGNGEERGTFRLDRPGFTSGSLSRFRAEGYAAPSSSRVTPGSSYKHVLAIDVPKGMHGAYIERRETPSSDREFILPRGAKLEIDKSPEIDHETGVVTWKARVVDDGLGTKVGSGPSAALWPSLGGKLWLKPREEKRPDEQPKVQGKLRLAESERRLSRREQVQRFVESGERTLDLMRGDKPIGYLFYSILDHNRPKDTFYLDYINIDPGQHYSLRDLRDLRESIRKLHPTVNRFVGYRQQFKQGIQSVIMAALRMGREGEGRSGVSMEDTPKAAGETPRYVSQTPGITQYYSDALNSGKPVNILHDVWANTHMELGEHAHMLPEGADLLALSRVQPIGNGRVMAIFTNADKSVSRELDIPWSRLLRTRALAVDGSIRFVTFSDRRGLGGLSGAVSRNYGAEVGHEVVHILYPTLDDATWNRLVGHANKLRLLDQSLADYSRAIGDEEGARNATPNRSVADEYNAYHTNLMRDSQGKVVLSDKNLEKYLKEKLDQEQVAHMAEWWMRGLLSDKEVEPVLDLLKALKSGELAGRGAAAAARGEAVSNLDMSPEARKARAERQGFDTSSVYYHGTPHTFDRFEVGPERVGTGGGDPYNAMSEYGVFFTRDHEIAEGYGAPGEFYIRPGRQKEITENSRDIDANMRIGKALKQAKAEGYNSAILRDIDPLIEPEFVVFNPADIRSVNAAFDPREESSSHLLAALGSPEIVGAAQKRELDKLGFYSQALEAAKSLKQEKGTPEQMLAQLKAAGVKDAEIKATGLDRLFAERSGSGEDTPNKLGGAITQSLVDVYHGTTADVGGELKPIGKKMPFGEPLPPALSLATTPEQANAFAKDIGGRYPGGSSVHRRKLNTEGFREVDWPSFAGRKDWTPQAWRKLLVELHDAGTPGALIKGMTDAGGSADQYVVLDALRLSGPAAQDSTGLSRGSSRAKGTQITKSEILSHLQNNRVEVREATYGKSTASPRYQQLSQRYDALNDEIERTQTALEGRGLRSFLSSRRYEGLLDERTRIEAQLKELNKLGEYARDAKWSQYSLDPSNPTYRETVLHLAPNPREQAMLDAIPSTELAPEAVRREMLQNMQPIYNYREGHFSDEPGYLFHARTSLQRDAAGHSTFLIDELQASGAQKIREGGARDEAKIAELEKRVAEEEAKVGGSLAGAQTRAAAAYRAARAGPEREAARRAYEDLTTRHPLTLLQSELATAKSATPSHPLVNTTDQWTTTAFRRLIRQAVEAGAERIAIVPGKVPADRFNLSHHIDTLRWRHAAREGEWDIRGEKGGQRVMAEQNIPDSELDGWVGREIASKMRAGEGANPADDMYPHQLDVGSIEIGGHGMRATYDGIYPRTLGKILAKMDPSIKQEEVPLQSSMDGRTFDHEKQNEHAVRLLGAHNGDRKAAIAAARKELRKGVANGTMGPSSVAEMEAAIRQLENPKGNPIQFHSFPLTDKIKQKVLDEGQAMFAIRPGRRRAKDAAESEARARAARIDHALTIATERLGTLGAVTPGQRAPTPKKGASAENTQRQRILSLANEGGMPLFDKYADALRELAAQHEEEINKYAFPHAEDPVADGMAYFFHDFVSRPDDAKANAPDLYDAFADFLDARDSGLLQSLQAIQQASEEYRQARLARLQASIGIGPMPPPPIPQAAGGGAQPPPIPPAGGAGAPPPLPPGGGARPPIPGVPPQPRGSARGPLKKFLDSYKNTFQPELFSEKAMWADALTAEYASARQNEKDVILDKSEQFYQDFRKLPDRDNIDYIQRVELGQRQPTNWLDDQAFRHRRMLDYTDRMEKLYGSKAQYVEDYFPHIWKDPNDARKHFAAVGAGQMGPKWFQKQRFYDLIEEGLQAGLELKSTNPEELVVMRLLAGVDMRQRMEWLHQVEGIGLARRASDPGTESLPRLGWTAIDAPNRERWFIAPDVYALWKNGVEAKGLWTQQNFVGSSFRGMMALKNVWVPIKLALSGFHPLHVVHINQSASFARAYTQLAEGHDVIGALKSAFSAWNPIGGALGAGVGFATAGPIGVPLGAWAGGMLGGAKLSYLARESPYRAGWMKSESERTPEEQAQVKLFNEGGFVPTISEEMRIKAKRVVEQAWDESKYLRLLPHGLRRAVEVIQKPLFEMWIPHVKAHAYLMDAAALFDRRPYLLDDEIQRKVALRAIAKSNDNRFGQMFYGSLFWNRILKDAGIASFLSLGWNLGFAREFGGGLVVNPLTRNPISRALIERTATQDTIEAATNKTAFSLIYMTTAAMTMGMITYANTGEQPEGWDYIFPRIGGLNPDGSPRRITNMSYLREIPMWIKHYQNQGGGMYGALAGTAEMLKNKLIVQPAFDLWNNADYWGYEIRSESNDLLRQSYQFAKQLFSGEFGKATATAGKTTPAQIGKYIVSDQMSPITVSGAGRAAELSGKPYTPWGSDMSQWPSRFAERAQSLLPEKYGGTRGVGASMLGFGPAPAYAEKSALDNYINRLYDRYVKPLAKPEEQREVDAERRRIRTQMQLANRGQTAAPVERRDSTGRSVRAYSSPFAEFQFKKLPESGQRAVLERLEPGTPEYDKYMRLSNWRVRRQIQDAEQGRSSGGREIELTAPR